MLLKDGTIKPPKWTIKDTVKINETIGDFKIVNIIGQFIKLNCLKCNEEFFIEINNLAGRNRCVKCTNCKNSLFNSKRMSREDIMKKARIDKFPFYNNNVKFIDIVLETKSSSWMLIKECIHCKNHISYPISSLYSKAPSVKKYFNLPYCGSCKGLEEKVDIVKGKYVEVKQTFSVGKSKNTMITVFKTIVRYNRITYMTNYFEVPGWLIEEEIDKYRIIFNYQADNFIRKHNLKFTKTYNDEQFKKVKEYVKDFKSNFPEPTIFPELIAENYNNIRLSYRHTFMANIERFSSRPDPLKPDSLISTILFENINFSNGIAFRDHAWADFHINEFKRGELKPGYLVKFEGYVYDYKRNYDGFKKHDLFSQSIGRIRNMEIISTSQRKDF